MGGTEALLLDALPLWKASEYRFSSASVFPASGVCRSAWVAYGEALARSRKRRPNFLGSERGEVAAVDAWIADAAS